MPLCSQDPTDIAAHFLRDEPALVSSLDFGPCVRQGQGNGPSLLIGDQFEIPLLARDEKELLDYRMALLAQPGDIVLVRKRDLDYEHYLARYLGKPDVTFLAGGQGDMRPMSQQARTSDRLFDACRSAAAASGGLTIRAYLTTGRIWRLAQAIGEAANCTVHVCGPSPRVVRRANDKLWFTQLARQVIGGVATPPTMAAYGPAGAAGLVKRIAATNKQVIVKVPDSAGSAGNIRLDSAVVNGMKLRVLRGFLLRRLHAAGWKDTYPVLVGVWDENVRCSPSAQIWIPDVSQGAPQVEGVFEQHVEGPAGEFIGGVPSGLPDRTQDQLRSEAIRIATVLQHLGYFGRCSLDAVLCGPERHIHWIECNGRWGGVSIPMIASRQLKGANPAIAIAQELFPAERMDTSGLIARLEDMLLRATERQTGIVITAPPVGRAGMLLSFLSIADTQSNAVKYLQEAVRRIRG